MSRKVFNTVLIVIVIVLGAMSCSPARHVPEGEVYYLGTKSLKYLPDSSDAGGKRAGNRIDPSVEIVKTLWVAPNGALLRLPFFRTIPLRLYFYNLFYTEEDSTFSSWMMENFGEPPVTISKVNPAARVDVIENRLFNNGYFGVRGNYELQYKKNRKRNKAWIRYSFILPEPYTYREVRVNLDSSYRSFNEAFRSYVQRSLVIPGNRFSLDLLSREKQLLWEHMQNEGYYYLKKNHILILADTTVGSHQLDLEFRIAEDAPPAVYRAASIGESTIDIASDRKGNTMEVNRELLEKAIVFDPGATYSYQQTQRTIRNLTGLGIFADPIVTYQPVKEDSSVLHQQVSLQPVDLFSVGLNTNLAVKSSGYVGPNVGVSAARKNLFNSARNLSFTMDGYMDLPYGVFSDRVSRSSGLSADISLTSPALHTLLPFVNESVLIPKRDLSLAFELNNRKDFFRLAEWKASYGLDWIRNSRISHDLNFINLSYARLIDSTAAFTELIEESVLLRNSYRNTFIVGPSYSFTFNNTMNRSQRLRSYFRLNVETSGNLVNLIQRVAGNHGTDMEFLGVEYSQYVRLQSDFRAYLTLGGRGSSLAFRNIIGLGKAYGNSTSMPYSRQFFIGGSNSLRPVTARTVGPGRYLEFDEAAYNQVGDLKFETNLEYRFKLFYIFYGALWADAGNIWLLKEDPDRPRSAIRWGNIIEDSYLTAGVGLRADLNFLIIRADYGSILYLPFLVPGYRWTWQNNIPLRGLVFGIGYPF